MNYLNVFIYKLAITFNLLLNNQFIYAIKPKYNFLYVNSEF